MIKLKELVIKTSFEDIWDVLIENYKDIVENHDQYNNVFKKLFVLEGAENIENIVIMIEKTGLDSEEVFYNVCGIKNLNEVMGRYNLSYMTWDKWLGYDVAGDTIAKYTPAEIVAHCIWEMTWNGFTEEQLQKRIEDLEWYVNESAKVDNFMRSIADNGGMINDSDPHKIIDSYNNDHSGYIECLLLDIIKKDIVTPQQLQYIMKYINLKEFDRQAYIYEARQMIKDGVVLNRDVILKLINFKAFDFIDKALDSNSVSKEALTELKCPGKNEPFRKVKLRLFEKSQKQMSKRNIKKIDYATPLSQLKDIEDDNIVIQL
jgi:hypothetical protein